MEVCLQSKETATFGVDPVSSPIRDEEVEAEEDSPANNSSDSVVLMEEEEVVGILVDPPGEDMTFYLPEVEAPGQEEVVEEEQVLEERIEEDDVIEEVEEEKDEDQLLKDDDDNDDLKGDDTGGGGEVIEEGSGDMISPVVSDIMEQSEPTPEGSSDSPLVIEGDDGVAPTPTVTTPTAQIDPPTPVTQDQVPSESSGTATISTETVDIGDDDDEVCVIGVIAEPPKRPVVVEDDKEVKEEKMEIENSDSCNTSKDNNKTNIATVVEPKEEKKEPNKVTLTADPQASATKLEDVENTINKLVHQARTSSGDEGAVLSPADIKSEIKEQVQTLKRTDLESLIMDKIIEAIAIHSNVGVLNQKLIQSNTQRDRLFHKISNLQRQVAELSKAVRSVSENVGRNQNSGASKTNQPIRFYRSVGIQVVLEGSFPPASVKSSSQSQSSQSVMTASKSAVLKSGTNAPQQNGPALVAKQLKSMNTTVTPVPAPNGNINPGLKRPLRPQLMVADMPNNIASKTIQAQQSRLPPLLHQELLKQQAAAANNNKMRRIGDASNMSTAVLTSPLSAVTNNILNGGTVTSATKFQGGAIITPQITRAGPPALQQMRNPAAVAAAKALNSMLQTSSNNVNKTVMDGGIVDLTDDDNPPKTSQAIVTSAIGATTMFPASTANIIVNGNPSNVVLSPQGYRLISPAGQQIQLIPSGKGYQLVTTSAASAQPRPVFVSPTHIQPRATAIRPATVPNSSSNQIVLRGMPNIMPASAGQTKMTPVLNAGQFVMRPLTTTVATRAPTSVVASVLPRTPISIVATRPGITVTPASSLQINNNNARPLMTQNGVANRLSANQQVRGGGSTTISRVAPKPLTASELMKKFTLPPLPPPAISGAPRRCSKDIPPRPELTLMEQVEGIVLSWTLKLGPNHAEIQTYQIYACQESLFNTQKSAAWKRVGDVKALPLPMACTLSQFTDENRYHFIVRGVDVYNRTGPFCEACAITLKKKS